MSTRCPLPRRLLATAAGFLLVVAGVLVAALDEGSLAGARTAMSIFWSAETTETAAVVPSAKVTVTLLAPAMTWSADSSVRCPAPSVTASWTPSGPAAAPASE